MEKFAFYNYSMLISRKLSLTQEALPQRPGCHHLASARAVPGTGSARAAEAAYATAFL